MSDAEDAQLLGIELVDEVDLPREIGACGVQVAVVASERVEDEIYAL